VQNNYGGTGGGLYCSYGIVENCHIVDNKTNNDGGAANMYYSTIRNCLVARNLANRDGGGIYAEHSVLQNNTICSNKANNQYKEQVSRLIAFIKSAKGYVEARNHDEINLKFESFREIFEGKKRIYFHANFANEINEIIDLSRELNFKFPVIVGGYDSWLLVERLKENNFSVVLDRLHNLPQFEEDDVNEPYKLPKKLEDAGVLYCLSMHGEMEAMNSRNLPFQAGTARAYGLENEEAIIAITLSPAKILGIDDVLGTVEEGKIATFFISDGDALDMKSNNVVMAMIAGRFLNLNNKQKQLYETYSNKY